MVRELTINTRASRGFAKDFVSGDRQKLQPKPANTNMLFEMFINDPLVSSACDITVDAMMANRYTFRGESESLVKSTTETFENDYDFDQVLPNLVYQMLIYGDAYLELVYQGGSVTEFHPLESSQMEMRFNKHGEVLGYQQKKDEQKRNFTTDQVIHFSLRNIGSSKYSTVPFEPISTDYTTKVYAKNYIKTIFENFPPRMAYFLETTNTDQIRQFLENLRVSKQNPHMDFVASGGKVQAQNIGAFEFSKGMVDLLNYLRQEILMTFRVPPIMLGIPDNSNRSNSDAQVGSLSSFQLRINSLQNHIASQINRELLPKLNIKLKFKFNPVTVLNEEKFIDIAQKMKQIGIDDDTVLQYIQDKGVSLRIGAKIEQPEISPGGLGKDAFPSRQKNVDLEPRKNNMEGGASKKVSVRSQTFAKYPYTY